MESWQASPHNCITYTLTSPVEEARDIRHGRLDRGAFPQVRAEDLETLYRRHDWFRDCQPRGNSCRLPNVRLCFVRRGLHNPFCCSIKMGGHECDRRPTVGDDTPTWKHTTKRIDEAVEGGVSVYYITPGGSRTQQRWVASFEDLGGIVIDKDHMNRWGEDYILYLKARLVEWQMQQDRFVVRQEPVAMVAPRGVQLAPCVDCGGSLRTGVSDAIWCWGRVPGRQSRRQLLFPRARRWCFSSMGNPWFVRRLWR
jgi:hypothetical protein